MSALHEYLISEAVKVKDGATVYAEKYWVVQNESVLLFQANPRRGYCSPQYNGSEAIAKKIQEKLYPQAEVRYLAAVYLYEDEYGIRIPEGAVKI
jgi:hypothetical protein